MIYDHYLTVREWSPNICHASDVIVHLMVWVRISGLPIDYYEHRVLTCLGNKLGKMIKVNKINLSKEIYVMKCVQVDLRQSLICLKLRESITT